MSFKVGDRVVINHKFDLCVQYRDRLIGQAGVITEVVPDAPECLFLRLDNPELCGFGSGGTWAVLEEELDKLED